MFEFYDVVLVVKFESLINWVTINIINVVEDGIMGFLMTVGLSYLIAKEQCFSYKFLVRNCLYGNHINLSGTEYAKDFMFTG